MSSKGIFHPSAAVLFHELARMQVFHETVSISLYPEREKFAGALADVFLDPDHMQALMSASPGGRSMNVSSDLQRPEDRLCELGLMSRIHLADDQYMTGLSADGRAFLAALFPDDQD